MGQFDLQGSGEEVEAQCKEETHGPNIDLITGGVDLVQGLIANAGYT